MASKLSSSHAGRSGSAADASLDPCSCLTLVSGGAVPRRLLPRAARTYHVGREIRVGAGCSILILRNSARMSGPSPAPSTHWSRLDALYGAAPDEAWQWFEERYRPLVRALLATWVRGAGRAAAAESEFWGYLFMSRATQRADRERPFRAFLFGVLRNFSRRWLAAHAEELEPASMPAEASSPMAEFEARLWVQAVVRNALLAMEAEHPGSAMVLRLFYGIEDGDAAREPLAAREVAARLGLNPQGIYMQLHRGRLRLRHWVEAELRAACPGEESFREELALLLRIAATRLPGLL